jgi:hypothetical protein
MDGCFSYRVVTPTGTDVDLLVPEHVTTGTKCFIDFGPSQKYQYELDPVLMHINTESSSYGYF